MGNSFFQFRQFKIEQGECEMKVCTDACILGAYAQHPAPARILDIGAGTGLLTLMLAQRYTQARIEAIEIDPRAGLQAERNFRDSPWTNRLQLYHSALQDFIPSEEYDMIISNPPFYQDHLKPDRPVRSGALHTDWLSLEELIWFISRHLSKSGTFWVLLPPSQQMELQQFAQAEGLLMDHRLDIRHESNSAVFRTIGGYSRSRRAMKTTQDELVIRENGGRYSSKMQQLLAPFYLEYNFVLLLLLPQWQT